MLQPIQLFLLFIILPCSWAFQASNLLIRSRSSNALASRATPTGLGNSQRQRAAITGNCNSTEGHFLLGTTNNNDISRRSLLAGIGLASPFLLGQEESSAALSFGNRGKESKIRFVSPTTNASDALQSEQVDLDAYTLNSEICLLKLLPVKNPVFRGLERSVVGLSTLKSAQCKYAITVAFLAAVGARCCCRKLIFLTDTGMDNQTKSNSNGRQTLGKGNRIHDGCHCHGRHQAQQARARL